MFFKKKKKDNNDGISMATSYKGDLDENGVPHGYGIMKYGEGTYEGRWEHGRRIGGVLTFNTGHRYEGAFDEDEYYTGHGKYYWPEGDFFEGEYVRGKRNGHGRYEFDDGSWLEAEYVDDKVNGPATRYRADDGCTYVGTMVGDDFEGPLKVFQNGELLFDGNSVHGQFKGQGRLYLPIGYVEGEWDTLGTCNGTFYGKDGTIGEVLAKNGRFIKGGQYFS